MKSGIARPASKRVIAPQRKQSAENPRHEKKGSSKPATKQRSRAAATNRKAPPTKPGKADVASIRITHPERVVFRDPVVTKQQVADYYTAVMPWLLPEVRDRPLSVIRCPDGTEGACFFQKHVTPGLKAVGSVSIREESGKRAGYLYAKDARSILELVQFGSIEFHPWGATIADPDRADRLVFDLDPAPEVKWPRIVAGARLLRGLLTRAGLQSFVRTSGGKGLHVVVPLAPAVPWAVAKAFCQTMANHVTQKYPEEFLATASKQLRANKIFIDWLRNARGATSVASYSLRARAGAPVAMPLAWDELGGLRGAHEFDIFTTPRRLARRRRDPWPGFAGLRQSLDHRNVTNTNDKRRTTR
jgi:bifunctional non-homologous end joining protein LigD